jgi:hypothetical protein
MIVLIAFLAMKGVNRLNLLEEAERKGSKFYIEQGISTGSMTFADIATATAIPTGLRETHCNIKFALCSQQVH